MKIKSFEFSYIKAFNKAHINLEKTSVFIGQNDHGKSSILKSIDIILNQLDEVTVAHGALHPDLAEKLLPLFPVDAKASRVTIIYQDTTEKRLHITVKKNLTFTVNEHIKRNARTTPEAVKILAKLKEHNKFMLIPALRDASSQEFRELFSRMLKEHGLSKMIPQKAGGTPKEYRKLKEIRDDVAKTIKPYIDEALLPQIEKQFGFQMQHKLALKFDVDVRDVGEWILENLRLGFELENENNVTLALSEAGSGVQSGVLLALHRLEQKASQTPNVQFILAVEEPEAFLHPQKQKELYRNIRDAQSKNLKVILTTHSPYIVAETPFSSLGLVKKEGRHSNVYTPEFKNAAEQEMFDAYSDEVNSSLFFADKVVLVEGESDYRVIKLLLEKELGPLAHKISVISASGNKNFSPFLRMIRAWGAAKIPHLVVTDFDSITASTDRAIFVGAKDAGYKLTREGDIFTKIDAALDKDEGEFSNAASEAKKYFESVGLNTFIFTSDLENALITADNKEAVGKIFSSVATNGVDYTKGYDINGLRRQMGSKGVPLNPMDKPPFKKPFIHKKVADTLNLDQAHPDIGGLLNAIKAL